MRLPAPSIAAYGAAFAVLLLLSGCQSPWVQATVVNQQNSPVNLVEVSYPGGTFGVQSIAPGASFHYRFHLLGTDQLTMDFTDTAGHDHKIKGPQLEKGDEGTLRILIEPGNEVVFTRTLTHNRWNGPPI